MHHNEFNYIALPASFSREDGPWIREKLATLPVGVREKIALAYSQAWQEAFDTEPVSFRKDNAARRTANRFLREFCTTYTPAIQGYTSLPPRV